MGGRVLALLLVLCAPAGVLLASEIYTVEEGDTLSGIARDHGCSLAQLRTANPDQGDVLSIGQRLRLPAACTAGGDPDRSGRAASSKRGPRSVPKGTIDGKVLPVLMAQHGFQSQGQFKAVVVDITLNRRGNAIARENWFDFKGSGRAEDNWNPASTVKLFSAIGALLYVKSQGFDARATATFHDPSGATQSYRVSGLVADALEKSDNLAHNRLVQLAGHDYLNGRILGSLRRTGIHKAYHQSAWKALTGGDEWLRNSPRIDLRQGSKQRTVPPRTGSGGFACPGSAACATLADLATVMRRFMLHEQLPPGQRYRLTAHELKVIRKSLSERRKRGMEVVSALESAFEPGQVVAYHKPGFAGDWMSDVVYLFKRGTKKRWIVVVAASPGRESVRSGARAIARILASGELE